MIAPVKTIPTKRAGSLRPNDEHATIPAFSGTDTVNYVYLLGRPTLGRFLRFMARHAVNGASLDEGVLADEWRAAFDHLRTLEKDEAGAADFLSLGGLPSELEPLRDDFLRMPLVQNSFNTVPTAIALVELDRLVV